MGDGKGSAGLVVRRVSRATVMVTGTLWWKAILHVPRVAVVRSGGASGSVFLCF